MNDTQFHETRMGQQYYERTLPEIARQLERLNELLERLVAVAEAGVGRAGGRPDESAD